MLCIELSPVARPVTGITNCPYESSCGSCIQRINDPGIRTRKQQRSSHLTNSLHIAQANPAISMASQDTITISSGEEDNDVEIVLVTKRPNRKRLKISDNESTQAEPDNMDEKSRDAAIPVYGSSAIARNPARARSAEIPTSSFEALPAPGRPRSAPLDPKRAIHVPTSLQHGRPDISFSGPDARPFTPNSQSSSYLSYPASSAPEQAYPTPKTISPSFCRRHLENLTSDSFMASVSGTSGLGAGEKDPAVVEGNRQASPVIVRARGLDDPFGLATGTRVSNSGLEGTCQTSRKNGKSMGETLGPPSQVFIKPSPQATFASSVQSAEGRTDKPNTKDAVHEASRDNNPSSRPTKRKLHLFNVERTVPQPRIRNRILWSTPAFQEQNNDGSGPLPLDANTELVGNSNALRQSTSTGSQEPRTQSTRKTWTCKMYADLAQQLQECFSFAGFAKKHSRSEQEVFDLFSAVVHLPLLQKSSTGLSRVSSQGHQSVRRYRTLIRETKTALAKEGKKVEEQPKKPTPSLKSSAETQGSRKEMAKTPSKDLLDAAMRVKHRVDAC